MEPYPAEKLKQRTKDFALRVIRLFRSLPRTEEARILGRQLLRSATSVAADYRAACRARSRADFVSKMGVIVEEADETLLWLELPVEGNTFASNRIDAMMAEAGEILAICAASQMTAHAGGRSGPGNRQSIN